MFQPKTLIRSAFCFYTELAAVDQQFTSLIARAPY